jgi:hypothetical protein
VEPSLGYRQFRRIAARVAWFSGLLIGASLLPAIAPSAALACATVNPSRHVEGYDQGSNAPQTYGVPHYGNAATIYVSTQSTVNSFKDADVRSIAVVGVSSLDDVEIGWGSDPINGLRHPFVFTAHQVNGVQNPPYNYYGGFSLSYDNDYRFKVQDSNQDGYFDYYVGDPGNTSLFRTSPKMVFVKGLVVTNSEHYNSCDSLWAHMNNLSYFNISNNWVNSYDYLWEYLCTSQNSWLFNKISNNEHYVGENAGVCF